MQLPEIQVDCGRTAHPPQAQKTAFIAIFPTFIQGDSDKGSLWKILRNKTVSPLSLKENIKNTIQKFSKN